MVPPHQLAPYVRRLFFSSTSAVFGEHEKALAEDDGPRFSYNTAKLRGLGWTPQT